MLSVEMLAAKYGDSLLVSWGKAAPTHHMLIDAGLSSAYPAVAARLRALDADIDLLVVTHVDLDHIGGAVKLLRDAALAERIKGVWFNGFKHIQQFDPLLGALDGERLSALIVERGLPWNKGWANPVQDIGGPIVVRDKLPVKRLGGAKITLLSPTPEKLTALVPKWREAVEAAGLKKGVNAIPGAPETGRIFLGGTLADLVNATSKPDSAEANGSSIAFVFEFQEKRVLFGADAHPDALVANLSKLVKAGQRYRVDACKLPHHGSHRNVTQEVVAALDCANWWFSSNGVRFNHPNDEALARVILLGAKPPTLIGNYRSHRWTAFTTSYPSDRYGYTIVLPDEGSEGIAISMG